jgi:predicted DNA-binding transcriptional regulator AlpA
MSDYVNTADMAAALGLDRAYVTDRVTKRPDFPAPALRLSRKVVLWWRAEFEAWQRAQATRAAKR